MGESGKSANAQQGPRCAGEQVWVCIASGPSLTKEDVEYVKGKAKVCVVNDNWRLAPWADVLYACDWTWWKEYINEVKAQFQGRVITQSGGLEPHQSTFADRHNIEQVPMKKIHGLGKDCIHAGGNSGHQAVNLVYLMGATKIILLGYDMQATGGKKHWFGDHPKGMNNANGLHNWPKNFRHIAKDLKQEGVEVINATRETALDCFEQMRLEDALGS